MSISTVHAGLTSARAALVAAMPGESAVDTRHANELILQADAALARYATRASYYNAHESAYAAAVAAYNAGVAARTARIAAAIPELDASARGAEQELIDAGIAGAWSPATPTSPATVAAVVARARTVVVAIQQLPTWSQAKPSLDPIAAALREGADTLEKDDATPVPPVTLPAPPGDISDTSETALAATINRFRDYLANV